MTEEINILLTASDEASGVIADASEEIDSQPLRSARADRGT